MCVRNAARHVNPLAHFGYATSARSYELSNCHISGAGQRDKAHGVVPAAPH